MIEAGKRIEMGLHSQLYSTQW